MHPGVVIVNNLPQYGSNSMNNITMN